ncbi:putative leucine-rich repeat extensin-like protein 3 [Iris pallida]|uniref:Leucine-rich repeat extensin-like protein 3 n=1 Tax=Iris pallida TaxID=29817 RepID=A0AAX6GLE5_IRIPA|nr:putative leucine-rich repeat extensin-like protein 3 [Iris pallida]
MLRMLSYVTTAITTLSCIPLCCQSPRRRTMELRLIDRFFLFSAFCLFQNSVLSFQNNFHCI